MKNLWNKIKIKGFIVTLFLMVFFCFSYVFYENKDFFLMTNIFSTYNFLQVKVIQSYFLYYILFFIIYFLISVFALPFAGILCLFIGALFGLLPGIVLASFASSLGALVCFLFARYLFKDYIEKKFRKPLIVINKGILNDGIYYLFFVRMVPIFPFFLINLLFSVTKIKPFSFYIVSQFGMLLGTALFINAGTQISKINSLEDILDKYVILSLILIAVLPFLIKKIIEIIKINYEKFK